MTSRRRLIFALGRAARCLAAAGALLVATGAHAQNPSPVSRAEIEADLLTYYGGEATAARVVAGLGVGAVGAGAYLLSRETDFSRAAGWPLLGFGFLETVGAISYSFHVDDEIAHYRRLLAKDPARFREAEIAHLTGTTDRFIYYRLGELGLAVAGVAGLTYGAIKDDDTAKGLGTGLLSIGLPFFLIDTVNNRRAVHYLERLNRFRPAVSLQLGAHGWALAIGGTF